MNLDRPWQRLTGLIIVLGCLAIYDPGAAGVDQRLILPLLMALGAWALVQNLAAVALAVVVLGIIHLDLGASNWIDRVAWPVLTLAAGLTLMMIGLKRFRRRIEETHESRWADRRNR